MRTTPWPVPVGVRVKELLRHPLDPGRGHGLRDAVGIGGTDDSYCPSLLGDWCFGIGAGPGGR